MIDHIMSDAEKNSFINTNPTFNNHHVRLFSTAYREIFHSHYDTMYVNMWINQFPMGILIFLMDENMKQTQPFEFEFDNVMLIINKQIIQIQYEEILTLEQNIYYLPMTLIEIEEQKLANTKECCWNNLQMMKIKICINNMNWNKNNSIIRSCLCISPLCYHNKIFFSKQ